MDLTAFRYPIPQGTELFEIVEQGRLKVGEFPGKTIDGVDGFTENAQFSVR